MFCYIFLADSRPVSVTYSDDGVDTLITEHYPSLTEQLDKLSRELKASHLKSYTGLSALQSTTKHVSSHMKHNERFIADMLNALHNTSQSLNQLNSNIMHKIEEEHLESWLERPIKMQGKPTASNQVARPV